MSDSTQQISAMPGSYVARPAVALSRSLVAICLIFSALAQQDESVAPSSIPAFLTVLGDSMVLSAEDDTHGRELWITEGEQGHAHLLKDIWPGPRGSNPENLYVLGNRLLFTALTPTNSAGINSLGTELWITDGTEENTVLVRDITNGPDGTKLVWMTQWAGIAYFDASDGNHGRELWRTDGTFAGTRLLKDISPGPLDSFPAKCSTALLRDGSFVFFPHANGGCELWISNGTDNGTQIIRTASMEGNVETSLLGKVLFALTDKEHGAELWVTDGTLPGTQLLKDIAQGPASSAPGRFCSIGDFALFKAWDETHGEELWRTDGTAEGTVLVKDLNAGLSDSAPYNFTAAGPYVYFGAVAAQGGREIWRTDGTASGTIMLKDVFPGPAESVPYALRGANGKLFFSALDPDHGEELWTSDGTPEGTRLVKDINPEVSDSKPASSFPDKSIEFKGKVYFRATTKESGCELWCSDGTTQGTVMLDDIWNTRISNPSSNPHDLTALNTSMFFVAKDIQHGNELFVTADDASTTMIVRDIFPGIASSDPHDLFAFNNTLYFGADDGTNGDELWRSDGTTEGTAMVQDYALGAPSSHPHNLIAYKGAFYFVSWRPEDGNELRTYVSGGIRRIRDIAPDTASSDPQELIVIGPYLYFHADDGAHGRELWVTEGDDGNTRMVYDLVPIVWRGSAPRALTRVENSLFFCANDGARGSELWSLNNTLQYPNLVADIAVVQSLVAMRDVQKTQENR